MTISFAGALPVSAVNVGLAASLGALDLEIAQLGVSVSDLNKCLAYKARATLNFPPNVPGYALAIGGSVNPLAAAARLNPGGFAIKAAPVAIDIGIQLGLVSAKLEGALAIAAPLAAGLSVGGIAGWSYAGSARGFGERLQAATAGGFGRTPATQQIQATILATESPATWLGLSSGVYTGPEADGLSYLGQLGASEWCTGLASLAARLRLFLGELRGRKATLQYQLEFCAGLEMPSADVAVGAAVDVVAKLGVGGLLNNLVNVDIGLDAAIGNLNARISALVDLKANIAAQLSGGGLAVWRYSGPASLLGTELLSEIRNGVPGGNGPTASVHGLLLAASPAAMGNFANIFLA